MKRTVKARWRYRRTVPVRSTSDVLVVGGGPAGVAAAVAAARQGARVRLIEAQSCLGGMGTAGLVPAFMQFTDGVNFLADGVGRQVLERLQAEGGTYPATGAAIRAEVLKRVYDAMLQEAGVAFTFHSTMVDVEVRRGCVTTVLCAGKSGLFAVRAKAVVDATGDGDVAAWAGAPYEKGDAQGAMMPGTLCSLWGAIDWDRVRRSGLGAGNRRIEQAFKDGVFTLKDRHLPGMWQVGTTVGGGNIGHTFGVDGTDEVSLTAAYLWGRQSLKEYERYYRKYLKGFEKMELVATGALLGVRETRRVLGDYVLNEKDYQPGSSFPDEIGRYSYPVDIHVAAPDRASYGKFLKQHTSMRLGHGESYGIPYRILTPRRLNNVLVAGRCVSTDRVMQSSIRVMPGCYITGQAAGVAAAMMARSGGDSRHVGIPELQKRLRKLGAYLPAAR